MPPAEALDDLLNFAEFKEGIRKAPVNKVKRCKRFEFGHFPSLSQSQLVKRMVFLGAAHDITTRRAKLSTHVLLHIVLQERLKQITNSNLEYGLVNKCKHD